MPQKKRFPDDQVPTADEMLNRLNAVDLDIFDLKQREETLKGKVAWVSALTIPISAIIITTVVLLTVFLSQSMVYTLIAFAITSMLLMIIAKSLESAERQAKYQAYQMTIQDIKNIEGEYGLIPHFRHFLPERYRHLWQSLRKGDYQHIKQYAQAVAMLQDRLEEEKFTHIWHLEYPQLAPNDEDDLLQ